MKTKEELEKLKMDWQRDPCWEIEDTEGFEEYRQELLEYSNKVKAAAEEKWRKEERKGGSAFPVKNGHVNADGSWLIDCISNGLNKREYFAGQAIVGLLANNDYKPLDLHSNGQNTIGFARLAYSIADALIKVGNE